MLLPGLGAVSTTFIAGIHAIRKGLAAPVGSVTQMGTIRLGKRTEGRTPLIRDFVPIVPIEDLALRRVGPVRGRRLYRGAESRRARTGAARCGAGGTGRCASHAGRLRPRFREEARRVVRQVGGHQDGPRRPAHRGHRAVPRSFGRRPGGDDLVRFHRDLPGRGSGPPGPRDVRSGPEEQLARYRAQHDLRVRRPQVRRAVRQRRAQPQRRHSGASGTGLGERRSRRRQGLQDRPDAHEDDPGAGPQGQDAGPQRLVLHQHPR